MMIFPPAWERVSGTNSIQSFFCWKCSITLPLLQPRLLSSPSSFLQKVILKDFPNQRKNMFQSVEANYTKSCCSRDERFFWFPPPDLSNLLFEFPILLIAKLNWMFAKVFVVKGNSSRHKLPSGKEINVRSHSDCSRHEWYTKMCRRCKTDVTREIDRNPNLFSNKISSTNWRKISARKKYQKRLK